MVGSSSSSASTQLLASLARTYFMADTQQIPNGAVIACRYATGSTLSGPDALIQDFYAAECSNAVSTALLVQRA